MAKEIATSVKALKEGRTYTYHLSDGGDLASMRGIFKYGQEITLSPVTDFGEVRVGDIVFLQWKGGSYILHLVQEIAGEQFLIVNSVGKVNGWVHGSAILGKVTRLVDPQPRPAVPEMLVRLEAACQAIIARSGASAGEASRLLTVVEDLRWYARRLGQERWERLPRPNKWSFASNLWYFTKRACAAAEAEPTPPVVDLTDQGKWVVGFAAEVIALLEDRDWEYL